TLPHEVEWEYACRAGTTTRFWSGDGDEDLLRVDWVDKNSGGTTHPVGDKPPNPWGLHDLHGNVWEWCADPGRTYRDRPSSHDPTTVPWPTTPSSGARRVFRGGSFVGVPANARSAFRLDSRPRDRNGVQGFRLVRASAPSQGPG
ncbi:MAG: formylglycine-generating enzyme family protein, partial [Myxococcota bacterium]